MTQTALRSREGKRINIYKTRPSLSYLSYIAPSSYSHFYYCISTSHSCTMSDNRFKHSDPISIPSSGAGHHRSRSVSFSTASSDDESNSPPLQTPSSSVPAPHIVTAHSPSTSPILSYFFQPQKNHSQVNSHSPTSMFGSMGRGFSARPHEQAILEEDEHEPSLVRHARRLSTSAGWTGGSRFNASAEQTERGAGLLRRLSLGNALVRVCPIHL